MNKHLILLAFLTSGLLYAQDEPQVLTDSDTLIQINPSKIIVIDPSKPMPPEMVEDLPRPNQAPEEFTAQKAAEMQAVQDQMIVILTNAMGLQQASQKMQQAAMSPPGESCDPATGQCPPGEANSLSSVERQQKLFNYYKEKLYDTAQHDTNPFLRMIATIELLKSLDTNHKDYQEYADKLFLAKKFHCSDYISCEQVLSMITSMMERLPAKIASQQFYGDLRDILRKAVPQPFYTDVLNFKLEIIRLRSTFNWKSKFFDSSFGSWSLELDSGFVSDLSEKLNQLRTSDKNPIVKYDLSDRDSVLIHNLASNIDYDSKGQLIEEMKQRYQLFLEVSDSEFLESSFGISYNHADEILFSLNQFTHDLAGLELYLQRTLRRSPMRFLREYFQPYLDKGNLEYDPAEGLVHPVTLGLLLAKFNTVEYRTPWGGQFVKLAEFFADKFKADDHWLTKQTVMYEDSNGEVQRSRRIDLNYIMKVKILEYTGGELDGDRVLGIGQMKRSFVQQFKLPAFDDSNIATLEQKEQWLAEHTPGFTSLFYEMEKLNSLAYESSKIMVEANEFSETAHISRGEVFKKFFETTLPKFKGRFIELACYGYWYTPSSSLKLNGRVTSDMIERYINNKPASETGVIFTGLEGELQLTNPKDPVLTKEETEDYNKKNKIDLHKYCGKNPNTIRQSVQNALTMEKIDDSLVQASLDHTMMVMNLFEMATIASVVNKMTHPIHRALKRKMTKSTRHLYRPALKNLAARGMIAQASAKKWSRRFLIVSREIPDMASAALGSILFSAIGEITKYPTPYKRDTSQYTQEMRQARKDGVVTVRERASILSKFLWNNYATESFMGFGLFYFSPKIQGVFIKGTGRKLRYGKNFGPQHLEMLKHHKSFIHAFDEFPLTASRLVADMIVFGSMPYVERTFQKLKPFVFKTAGKSDDIWQGWNTFGYDYLHGFMVGAFFSSSHSFWRDYPVIRHTHIASKPYTFFGLEVGMSPNEIYGKINERFATNNLRLRIGEISKYQHYKQKRLIERHASTLEQTYGRIEPISYEQRFMLDAKSLRPITDWKDLGLNKHSPLYLIKEYYESVSDKRH